MTPEIQVVVHATQSWLRSSWHVQVPFAWLEACVEWLQEEAGGAARLSQQQINQQALDQWLLTDLRDLDHPVLPERLAQAQKTELSGTFCVQVCVCVFEAWALKNNVAASNTPSPKGHPVGLLHCSSC